MAADATQGLGWYVTRDSGEMDGPLSDADMRSAITRGRVKPEDRVWRDGMDEWVEARRIPNYEELRKSHLDAIARQANAREERHAEQTMRRSQAQASRTPVNQRSSRGWNAEGSSSAGRAPRSEPQETQNQAELPDIGELQAKLPDFKKMTEDALGTVSKIPQGAIVFFVLGLIITPLLPVFWFIAWSIWASRKK